MVGPKTACIVKSLVLAHFFKSQNCDLAHFLSYFHTGLRVYIRDMDYLPTVEKYRGTRFIAYAEYVYLKRFRAFSANTLDF